VTRLAIFCACVVATAVAHADGGGQCNPLVGTVRTHTVRAGDSLAMIAARAGLPTARLAADNALPPDARLRRGQVLRLDNRHIVPHTAGSGMLINVPQRMLFVIEDGEAVAAYPVAAGQPDWQTPFGIFEISAKEVDPTWDVPLSIQREMRQQGRRVLTRIGPGPQNPLGDRWMAVGATGIGIHGTNSPASIFSLSTHGCIRLHPEDIRDLFDRVHVGTLVRIVYEPVLTASDAEGRTWVEVHPDAYGLAPPPPPEWPQLGRAVVRPDH
jgi:L,D-transpeptidase ErfK/SrfK